MGDHDTTPTCLSSEKHGGEDVRDYMLHYFGCLGGEDRSLFLASLFPSEQQSIKEEESRIQRLRLKLRSSGPTKVLIQEMIASREEYDNMTPTPCPPAKRQPKSPMRRSSKSNTAAPPLDPTPDPGYGMKASIIFFKDSKPFNALGFQGEFPNQTIPVRDLLKKDERNPLMQKCQDKMIRYFHLPANNMTWVEEAIARYYMEERPRCDDIFRKPSVPSKTYMLLRPEYWRGQQHGGSNDTVHARHMRPQCNIISVDPGSDGKPSDNLVLFMPYLHWETNRRRAKLAEAVRETTEGHRAGRMSQGSIGPGDEMGDNGEAYQPTCSGVVRVAGRCAATRPKKLGVFLRKAAALAEVMDCYEHEEMLKACLHANPPLHPRRTLDQSYYWTLDPTEKRDRDQVVYRATAPVKESMHYLNCKEDRSMCEHTHCEKKHSCEQCMIDIRKLPRVVMVDQLWLWILDENTVITSFPERWGRDRPDPSGVHERLRLRLETTHKAGISSAYDLALIIIDQCTRVFFDFIKTADRQPQVMDIFAKAIGDVTIRQINAYEKFWDYTHTASVFYNNNDAVETADMHKLLLDINPEGELMKEIQDILDELQMMKHIKEHQKRVLGRFTLHMEQIIDRSPTTEQQRKENARWKLIGAKDLSASLEEGSSGLNELYQNAELTQAALERLLALKQQQAGVVEAREAVTQGRSIMLFTVIAIVFLPLSFIASVFGMNVTDFKDGLMTIRGILVVMLPTSLVVIFISCLLAFNVFTRALLAYSFSALLALLLTSSRLYDIWSGIKFSIYSTGEKKTRKVRLMKEMARDKARKKAMKKAREKAMEKEKEKAKKRLRKMDIKKDGVWKIALETVRAKAKPKARARRAGNPGAV